MRVRLAYGETRLDIDVDPDLTTAVEPVRHRAAVDRRAALAAALRDPVGSGCGQGRPSPSRRATALVRSHGT